MRLTMKKIRLLSVAIGLAILGGGRLSADPDRPNVIFILCDDLGNGDVGTLFQNDKIGKKQRTPHLDTMASEGVTMMRHYCSAPVCAPSRGSLLLGVHQGHSNVRDNQFDKALADQHTLGSVLKAAGYHTALIGKYGLQGDGKTPAEWDAFPTKRGFDTFFGYVRHSDGHTHYPAHRTASRGTKELYDQDQNIQSTLAGCYTADLFTARAKKWIIDQTAKFPDQPFFLTLAFDTPHAALQLPTMAYPSGGGVTGGVQWIGTPGHMINTADADTVDRYRHPDYTTAVSNSWTDVEERFATSVRRLDDCIGDLLKTLRDLNIATNTLVVFTSDNGPHEEDYLAVDETRDGSSYSPESFQSYGPFEGIKRDIREGGIRMPLLAWWPGVIAAGTRNDTVSQFQDWMPTLAELAGIPAPARTDGVSLLPDLKGGTSLQEHTVYIEYYCPKKPTPAFPDFIHHAGESRNQMQAIFMDGYKGVRLDVTGHAQDFEIYDLTNDPKEGNNLAGSSDAFKALQQRMKDRVLQVRRPDQEAPRPYDRELVPSVKADVVAGVDYTVYEGSWPWVPLFDTLTGVKKGTADDVNLSVRTRDEDVGLLFSGYLNVPADGDYAFYLSADTGALLRIHDAVVIDADYGYEGSREISGMIKLRAGLHPYRLYYRSGKKISPQLSWSWSGPGIGKAPVPGSVLMKTPSVSASKSKTVAVGAVKASSSRQERPNIVWFVCEDMSPTIGPYGDAFATTPNLDRFSKEAFRYDRAWANGAVCSVSRSTLITGLYGASLGVNSHRAITKTATPSFLRCYPQLLRDVGYYTANNSKTDYNLDLRTEEVGWDDSSKTAHWRNRPAGKPFLAVFNNGDTHEGKLQGRKAQQNNLHDPAGVQLPECHPDTPACRDNWAQHYDGITSMDTAFQAVIDQLKADGLYDDTIIFFYSDHGSAMPGYKRYVGNRGQQIALFVRIPEKFAHLAPPGYTAGGSTGELVSFVDFAPTLLSLAGSEPPGWQQGRAFAGSYAKKAPAYVYGFADRFDERTWLARSVFDGRYVYIRNYQPGLPHGRHLNFTATKTCMDEWHDLFLKGQLTEAQAHYWLPQGPEELYDLATDPDEVRNLAARSDYQAKLKELRAAHVAWRDTYPDAGFLTEGVLQEFCDTSGLDAWSVLHDPRYYPKAELLDTVDRASSASPADISALVSRLSHTNMAVRVWALKGLNNHGCEAVRSNEAAIVNSLSDPSVWVRIAAAQTLATHGSAQNQKTAIEYLFATGSQSATGDRAEYEAGAAVLALDELPALPESYTKSISSLPEKFAHVKALKQHLLKTVHKQVP